MVYIYIVTYHHALLVLYSHYFGSPYLPDGLVALLPFQHVHVDKLGLELCCHTYPVYGEHTEMFQVMYIIYVRICLNISPGFYFLNGSRDPASK